MDDTWIIGNVLFQAILQANDPTTVEKLLSNEIDYTDPAVLAAYEQLDDMFDRGYFGDRSTVAAFRPGMASSPTPRARTSVLRSVRRMLMARSDDVSK